MILLYLSTVYCLSVYLYYIGEHGVHVRHAKQTFSTTHVPVS